MEPDTRVIALETEVAGLKSRLARLERLAALEGSPVQKALAGPSRRVPERLDDLPDAIVVSEESGEEAEEATEAGDTVSVVLAGGPGDGAAGDGRRSVGGHGVDSKHRGPREGHLASRLSRHQSWSPTRARQRAPASDAVSVLSRGTTATGGARGSYAAKRDVLVRVAGLEGRMAAAEATGSRLTADTAALSAALEQAAAGLEARVEAALLREVRTVRAEAAAEQERIAQAEASHRASRAARRERLLARAASEWNALVLRRSEAADVARESVRNALRVALNRSQALVFRAGEAGHQLDGDAHEEGDSVPSAATAAATASPTTGRNSPPSSSDVAIRQARAQLALAATEAEEARKASLALSAGLLSSLQRQAMREIAAETSRSRSPSPVASPRRPSAAAMGFDSAPSHQLPTEDHRGSEGTKLDANEPPAAAAALVVSTPVARRAVSADEEHRTRLARARRRSLVHSGKMPLPPPPAGTTPTGVRAVVDTGRKSRSRRLSRTSGHHEVPTTTAPDSPHADSGIGSPRSIASQKTARTRVQQASFASPAPRTPSTQPVHTGAAAGADSRTHNAQAPESSLPPTGPAGGREEGVRRKSSGAVTVLEQEDASTSATSDASSCVGSGTLSPPASPAPQRAPPVPHAISSLVLPGVKAHPSPGQPPQQRQGVGTGYAVAARDFSAGRRAQTPRRKEVPALAAEAPATAAEAPATAAEAPATAAEVGAALPAARLGARQVDATPNPADGGDRDGPQRGRGRLGWGRARSALRRAGIVSKPADGALPAAFSAPTDTSKRASARDAALAAWGAAVHAVSAREREAARTARRNSAVEAVRYRMDVHAVLSSLGKAVDAADQSREGAVEWVQHALAREEQLRMELFDAVREELVSELAVLRGEAAATARIAMAAVEAESAARLKLATWCSTTVDTLRAAVKAEADARARDGLACKNRQADSEARLQRFVHRELGKHTRATERASSVLLATVDERLGVGAHGRARRLAASAVGDAASDGDRSAKGSQRGRDGSVE